ncbi:MAG TPA: VPLPA-CTERM-specific exosortase XrtD [Dongiaceae bacterium]|nr:VPLPA-CTERM-specific exosortase XrtD [Dongiaceae bacterium]
MAADLARMSAGAADFHAAEVRPGPWRWIALAACLVFIGYFFHDSIESTVDTWLTSPEYNYGPLVPLLAALMLWRDLGRSEVTARDRSSGWLGVAIAVFGLLFGLVEVLSQTRFPGQLGLFLTIVGIVVAWLGERRAAKAWPALALLFFALPQSAVLQVALTAGLQLVSSVGAVAIIQMFGIPVLREGNIIDLGQIQLQVAEACAGLRYLFPLATFAFLCAYLYVGHPVKKAIIFLSSIPITILMNIVRIAVTGLLVDRYGAGAAEGFFHYFEGWIVFVLCLGLLFLEMKLLCYAGPGDRSLLRRLDLDPPRTGRGNFAGGTMAPVLVVAGLCAAAVLAQLAIGARDTASPARASFALFPREIAGWQGADMAIETAALVALNATDHLSVNYAKGDDVINVWSAYYDSQYSGNAAHSPLVCIPGGGWLVEDGGVTEIPVAGGATLSASRLIISQGTDKQLVYFWFVEGGRHETGEYAAKFRLFANAVLHNRRDGALVRFVTPVVGGDLGRADATLKSFIAEAAPLLPAYVP